ncbi:hypothetical protein ABK905_11740 [Acerihabitans sp. KWT182]|uniref:JmjC domain-containing protein n=1 Tax=Acerihabitans sp. KWT182 TaxID=3157919 RepID=A0AAU7QEL0_9GAMM
MAHLPGMLPGYQDVYRSIAKMFSRFSEAHPPQVRAWVGKGERYTVADELIKLASRAELGLERRLARASASERFCVALNGLSAWCADFALRMQTRMLEPLFLALGEAPQAGADFYSFFGNYGYTPFGVHDDTDHSLLWHLGPSPKTAYVWPRAVYLSLTQGALATADYLQLMPYARRTVLQAGDLLFIPRGDFHILETRGFSATLGLTLFPDDPAQECLEGARLLVSNGKTLSSLASAALTLGQLGALRRLALESNGHIITRPALSGPAGLEASDAELQRALLRVYPFWPLRHMALAEREALLVRGRLVLARANPLFGFLCEELAAGHPVGFADLARRLPATMTTGMLADAVRNIARLGGLRVESL